MKTSTLLTLAKSHLAEYNYFSATEKLSQFTCLAISFAAEEAANGATRKETANLKKLEDSMHTLIDNRLCGHDTLDAWLDDYHGIACPEGASVRERHAFNIKLQDTRHQWLDSMIAEFKAKRD